MSCFKPGQLVRRNNRIRSVPVSDECFLLLKYERSWNGLVNGFWQILTSDGRLGIIVDSTGSYEVVS